MAPATAGLSFAFSKEMLARSASDAKGGTLPPLQNLSLKTAPTAAAYAPDAQFDVLIRLMRFADMNPQAMGTRDDESSKMWTYISNLNVETPKDNDLILWLTLDNMPHDIERLRYAGLVYNKILRRQLSGRGGELQQQSFPKELTPPGAYKNDLNPCDPWKSKTTLIYHAQTEQQKKYLLERMALDSNPGRLYKDDEGDSSAARRFGVWLFGKTTGDGVGDAPAPGGREITQFTRPAMPAMPAAAAAGGMAESREEEVEQWKRTMQALPTRAVNGFLEEVSGAAKYRFEYMEEVSKRPIAEGGEEGSSKKPRLASSGEKEGAKKQRMRR